MYLDLKNYETTFRFKGSQSKGQRALSIDSKTEQNEVKYQPQSIEDGIIYEDDYYEDEIPDYDIEEENYYTNEDYKEDVEEEESLDSDISTTKLKDTQFHLDSAIGQFNQKLYDQLDKNENGNIIFSPFRYVYMI